MHLFSISLNSVFDKVQIFQIAIGNLNPKNCEILGNNKIEEFKVFILYIFK